MLSVVAEQALYKSKARSGIDLDEPL